MAAVCGPDAAAGGCERSVVQQLSTMPSYMYKGGDCPDPKAASAGRGVVRPPLRIAHE
jgi:hypothetical protein